MNELEKDQAIFKAMLEIANDVFTNAVGYNGALKKEVSEKGGVISLKEINSTRSMVHSFICDGMREYHRNNPRPCEDDLDEGIRSLSVGSFTCSFHECQVFSLLDYWKSLAKMKDEVIFTYEEKVDLPHITTITITLDNAANAKKLTKCCCQDDLRPAMACVLAELNLDTETVSFVGTDGHVIGIVTTDKISVHRNNPTDRVLRALFRQKDWERICDHAKKNGNDVTLEFYYHSEGQTNDTAVAILGDTRIKSTLQDGMRYPNWHSVMPFYSAYQHLRLTKDGADGIAKFIKNDKNDVYHYVISAYEGCDDLYIEFTDYDFSKNVVMKFKLESPATSDIYFGAAKHQMKKICANGFWFKDANTGAIIDTKEFDIMLMMPCDISTPIDPMTADERRGFILHPEEVDAEVYVEEFVAA